MVALLACLQPVLGTDLGVGIVDLEDAMAAVTVEALGGGGIAQRIDLAMVGVAVGFQVVFMATAAFFREGQLDRAGRGVADAVRGMAVDAHRRLQIVLLVERLAMHGAVVFLQFVAMALLAANIGHGPAPFVGSP